MKTPILDVRFFATESGNEPVREWLKALPASERRTIGEDIKTVQFGWPLGMPLVRKLAKDLWGIRIHLVDRIARLLFTRGRPHDDLASCLHQEITGHTSR